MSRVSPDQSTPIDSDATIDDAPHNHTTLLADCRGVGRHFLRSKCRIRHQRGWRSIERRRDLGHLEPAELPGQRQPVRVDPAEDGVGIDDLAADIRVGLGDDNLGRRYLGGDLSGPVAGGLLLGRQEQ